MNRREVLTTAAVSLATSAFGPLLIAHLRQASGTYVSGMHVIAGVMAISVVLPLLVRPPARMQA